MYQRQTRLSAGQTQAQQSIKLGSGNIPLSSHDSEATSLRSRSKAKDVKTKDMTDNKGLMDGFSPAN